MANSGAAVRSSPDPKFKPTMVPVLERQIAPLLVMKLSRTLGTLPNNSSRGSGWEGGRCATTGVIFWVVENSESGKSLWKKPDEFVTEPVE